MKYGELGNFTYGELKYFTYGQLSLDKFDLIEKISSGEIELPNDVSQKLYDLCAKTVHRFESITGERIEFVQPSDKNTMTLKDKINCISLLFNIFDRTMANENIKELLSTLLSRFVDFFNELFK